MTKKIYKPLPYSVNLEIGDYKTIARMVGSNGTDLIHKVLKGQRNWDTPKGRIIISCAKALCQTKSNLIALVQSNAESFSIDSAYMIPVTKPIIELTDEEKRQRDRLNRIEDAMLKVKGIIFKEESSRNPTNQNLVKYFNDILRFLQREMVSLMADQGYENNLLDEQLDDIKDYPSPYEQETNKQIA